MATKKDPELARALVALGTSSLPSRTALEQLAKERLIAGCRALELRGVSRLRKNELVDALHRELRRRDRKTVARGARKTPEAAPADAARPAPKTGARKQAPKAKTAKKAKSRKGGGRKTPRRPPAPSAASGQRPESAPEHIPWSYGEDRVIAMAVDPERLFSYWEVSDDAIARACERLGPGGEGARLNLRIYDTTGRLFDGTNAHSYFDHAVGREERQWFFQLDKPGSEAFVELGMKSRAGYFVKIARSRRVDFPRRGAAAAREPLWMTVRGAPAEPASWAAWAWPELVRPSSASGSGDLRARMSEPARRSDQGVEPVGPARSEGSGSSEHLLGGASEHRFGGASERRLGGASEGRLDSSRASSPERDREARPHS